MGEAEDQPKRLTKFQKFQAMATIILAVCTTGIAWKTYTLNSASTANEARLKELAADIESQRLSFDRTRDAYDRIQNYLASDQDERQGRALVAFVRTLPEAKFRYEFLSILSANAENQEVAVEASESYARSNLPVLDNGKSAFVGNLVLEFLNDGRVATLGEEFGFVDSNGVQWTAPEGATTDGASIPVAFRSILGSPFDEKLVKAAVIHDYYIESRERTWEATHAMFYEALIASGVSEVAAKMFYAALYTSGPRWNEKASE